MEALTKQNGVRLLGKLKKKFKKKGYNRPTLPKFLQEEIGKSRNSHIFFGLMNVLSYMVMSKRDGRKVVYEMVPKLIRVCVSISVVVRVRYGVALLQAAGS